MTTTIIDHNGSKWAGDLPDHLDMWFERLAKHTLASRFYPYATSKGRTMDYFGNFDDVSAGFRIITDDEEVIARANALIKANPGYHPETP